MAWRKVGNLKGPQGPQGESGADYELPTASATQLGGVKVGDGLSVAADGTVSTSGGQTLANDEFMAYVTGKGA